MAEIPVGEGADTRVEGQAPQPEVASGQVVGSENQAAATDKLAENSDIEVLRVYKDLLDGYIRIPYKTEKGESEISTTDFQDRVLSLIAASIDQARVRVGESELRKQIFEGLLGVKDVIDKRSEDDTLTGVELMQYRQSTLNLLVNLENGEMARIRHELSKTE